MKNKLTVVDLETFLAEAANPIGEVYEIDQTIDAFDPPEPVPEGAYLVRVKLKRGRPEPIKKTVSRKGIRYSAIPLETEIIQPLQAGCGHAEGRIVWDVVNTRPYRQDGYERSGIARLLDVLGVDRSALRGNKALRALVEALKREPIVRIDIRWRAYSSRDGKVLARRASHFPIDKNGRRQRWIYHTNGERVWAEAQIIRYLPVTDGTQPSTLNT